MSQDCDVCGGDWQGDHKICELVKIISTLNDTLIETNKLLKRISIRLR